MSKKFTCFLAVVITMLLAMPVKAQDITKKHSAPTTKVIKSFGKYGPSKSSLTLDDRAKPLTKSEAAAKEKAEKKVKGNKQSKAMRPLKGRQNIVNVSSPKRIQNATGEVIDEHNIIITPAEGVRKVYSRSGKSYVNDDGINQVEQDGNIQLVFCDDGSVYIRNIMYGFPTNGWVKGTSDGNTITVETKQPIYYNSIADVTYSINWGVTDEFGFFSYNPEYSDHFSFIIDQETNTISLQNSSESNFMGLFWDDDNAFTFIGDYETVWTYVNDFEPMTEQTVNAPTGLNTESWYAKSHTIIGEGKELNKGNITIGFDGNDIYLKGVFAEFPEAWMKGTIDGETVTFEGLQIQGMLDGTTIYAVGAAAGDLVPFTMSYDSEQKILTSNNILLLNASKTDIVALKQYSDLTIQLSDPFAPIEVLPYTNGFDTLDEWEMFTVVDSNNDGSTWQQYENMASYKYNSENNGDDWLFSPAFRLEAGKFYHFSIDALCSSDVYDERIEIKIGKDMNSDAMTTDVIPSTEIATVLSTVLENKLIEISETGTYYIGIHAISDADHASLRVDNFMLDETILTAPAAVTDLIVTPDPERPIATLQFTAPTKTIGGDELKSITKIEILREGEVISTLEDVIPGSTHTYIDNDESLTFGLYHYQVLCYNSDGKGDISEAIGVQLIIVESLPYYADFSNDEDYDKFKILDANEDYFTWEWGGSHATYSYSTDNQADDYLISPPLHMDAGKNYEIVVNAGSAGYPEHFEVVVGQTATAEGLSNKILEGCEVIEEDEKDFTANFTPTETGSYYVAVHCISEPDQYELWINSLSVVVGPEGKAPAAPQITLTPGDEGALNALLAITAPTQTYDGTTTLTENLSKIEIYRNGEIITEIPDVTPGTTVNFTDEQLAEPGTYTYQAVPYNTNGIGGKSEKVSSYIGMDVPMSVTYVQVKDQLTSVLLSWDKVGNEGRNGGFVNTAEVYYKIYACEPNTTHVFDDQPVAIVKDADSFELAFDSNAGEQGFQGWVVTASNEIGDSYMVDESLVTMITGTPYELPIVEGFKDGTTHYYWDSNSVALQFSQSSDDDGIAFALVSQQAGDIFLSSGKLNINDAVNPMLIFDAVGFGVSNLTVIGRTNSGEAVELSTETINDSGYTTIKIPLASLKKEGYAQFAITATIANATTFDDWTGEIMEQGDALILDNIRVIDLYQHNMAVELSAPTTIMAGKTADLLATITNWGEQPAKDYIVTFKVGDDVIQQQTYDTELAPFSNTQVICKMSTSIFEEAGDRTISVQIDYNPDENIADNHAESVITIKSSDAQGPESLVAEDKGAAGVDLKWEAPIITNEEYTETFDNTDAFPSFDLGGITEKEHTGTIGEWSVYDATGAGVYGWNGIEFPNQYQPSAWMVFDFEKAGFEGVEGHSGSQVMLSICPEPVDGNKIAADHWLISPKLSGMEQTISFYIRAITDSYGEESFEVLASSTDNNPDSFALVESFSTDAVDWTEFNTLLPEGTKYFAIRHTSNDIFGLFLDDITFNYSSEVDSYNIYYEGKKIASVEEGVTTYTIEANLLEAGERMFAVTAVYKNGQESNPAIAKINVTTGIDSISLDGMPVDVYTIDGKMIQRQAKSLEGLNGIYVINGKTMILK